jgi:hypothetical protein
MLKFLKTAVAAEDATTDVVAEDVMIKKAVKDVAVVSAVLVLEVILEAEETEGAEAILNRMVLHQTDLQDVLVVIPNLVILAFLDQDALDAS